MDSDTPRHTESGIPLKRFYGPDDRANYESHIGDPGSRPYTRGNFSTGYDQRLWTFRQYSGFGTPEESNQRYKMLLERGATGLSVAADLPTQIGYDSDDPDAVAEVGRVGVAVDSLADAEVLFRDIPLDQISTSFTINGTAAIALAMYIATGEAQGVPRSDLTGTIQNDILKEYVARGTWIWPVRPSVRLIGDTIEFCAAEVPRFNAVSIAGAHFRDAGASAVQELAFTLADALAYCDEVVGRGNLSIDEFARQISFFFYTHSDFFEEVAKYRAGRRMWSNIVRERYGASKSESGRFRVGVVCGGSTLYAPQPMNNAIRVAYQALAAVLGGVQSMFTAAWDEPFALPTEDSATLALRTQQILAYETGVPRVVDPLGGSYFVEALTDEMEEAVSALMSDVAAHGGMIEAIEEGYVQKVIADAAYERQRDIESGERPIVGVNCFETDEPPSDVEMDETDPRALQEQLDRLETVRRERDGDQVKRALGELQRAAAGDDNLMPFLVEAVKAYCTVGEITTCLKDVWGEYQPPTVF